MMPPAPLPTDEELLVRLRAGDPTACDTCVRAHSDAIFRLARRMLDDDREAEDVVQETFFNAWKSLDGFDGRARLGTWLFRIAYNAALMRLRNKPQVESLDADSREEGAGGSMPEHVLAWEETPEKLVERKETAEILDRAIGALSPTLRAAFVLRDLEDRSTAETAQILGVSEQVVKVRLHRARLDLRERLGEYYGAGAAPARTMTCEQLVQYLSDYIDKDIDAPLKRQAEEHIATCRHCQVLLDTTQKTLQLYRENKPRVMPIADRERLYREIKAAFEKRKKN
jgi:RNA polymerase sigma-70 factor, ECF subfamily